MSQAGPGATSPDVMGVADAANATSAPEDRVGGGARARLWGGRFAVGPAASLDALNRSLQVDVRLWREDIEASRAWAHALAGAGVLTSAEASTLDAGLLRVAAKIEAGAAEDAADEDIHSLVERLLYDEVGDVAGKLHTGRSRNDQVATDARLWLMRACTAIDTELVALEAALVTRADETVDLLIPAYTHLRRAQPVRVAHWLLSHFWALERDRARLAAARERTAVLPLGSGAIAGAGFAVDRELLRELLDFSAVSPNSIDAVGDRDWVAEFVFVAATLATHLSRLAEDLILYSSDEFGFLRLSEELTTGSSLMPQKRNPDGLELARGKAARLIGDVATSLALLKGLASGYHKDLQEDKTLIFHAVDDLLALLPVTRDTIAGLRFDEDALSAAASDESLLATDLADELVRRGVPFREAHRAVGRLVRDAESSGVSLGALSRDALAAAHPAFATGDVPTLSAEASVEARSLAGGTGRRSVLEQLAEARRRISS